MERNKFSPVLSKCGTKFKIAEGSYSIFNFECLYVCNFWQVVKTLIFYLRKKNCPLNQRSGNTFSCSLDISAYCIKALLCGTRRCVLPHLVRALRLLPHSGSSLLWNLALLEAISFWLKNKPFKLFHIWGPFVDYSGGDGSQAVRSSICGLA